MVFQLRAMNQIKEGSKREDGFNDTIRIMAGHHGKDLIQSLDQPRRHQMQFLDTAIGLDSVDAKIFTGLSLIVIAETAKTYGEKLSQTLRKNSKTRHGGMACNPSVLVQRLVIDIGMVQLDENKKPIKEENKFDPEDIISLIDAAVEFIGNEVYINKDSRAGYKTQHSFSHIEELNISGYLRIAAEIRSQATNELIDRNDKKLGSDLKEEKAAAQKEEKAARQIEKEKAALQKEKEKEEKVKDKGKGKGGSYSTYLGRFMGSGKKADLKDKGIDEEEEVVTSEDDTDDEDNGNRKKI